MTKVLGIGGRPAVGKGTVLARLAEHCEKNGVRLAVVSTSDAFKAVAADDPLKLEIDQAMSSGLLVPERLVERVMIPAIRGAVEESTDILVIDAMPRNRAQGANFKEFLEALGLTAFGVIVLEASEAEVRKRRKKRIAETKAAGKALRSDDRDEDAFEKRLREFLEETEPGFEIFEDGGGLLIRVDAAQGKEEMFQEMLSQLEAHAAF